MYEGDVWEQITTGYTHESKWVPALMCLDHTKYWLGVIPRETETGMCYPDVDHNLLCQEIVDVVQRLGFLQDHDRGEVRFTTASGTLLCTVHGYHIVVKGTTRAADGNDVVFPHIVITAHSGHPGVFTRVDTRA